MKKILRYIKKKKNFFKKKLKILTNSQIIEKMLRGGKKDCTNVTCKGRKKLKTPVKNRCCYKKSKSKKTSKKKRKSPSKRVYMSPGKRCRKGYVKGAGGKIKSGPHKGKYRCRKSKKKKSKRKSKRI